MLQAGRDRCEITLAKSEHIDWTERPLLVSVSKLGTSRTRVQCGTRPRCSSPSRAILPALMCSRSASPVFNPWNRTRRSAGPPDVRLHDLGALVNQEGRALHVRDCLSTPRMTQSTLIGGADAARCSGGVSDIAHRQPKIARIPATASLSSSSRATVWESEATALGGGVWRRRDAPSNFKSCFRNILRKIVVIEERDSSLSLS
jgi:hypothetical protein